MASKAADFRICPLVLVTEVLHVADEVEDGSLLIALIVLLPSV